MTDLVYNDRRSFLKSMGVVAGVAGAAGAAAAPVLLSASPAGAAGKVAPAAPPRPVDAAGFGLELGADLSSAGVMLDAEGGWPSVEVEEEPGEGGVIRKRPGRVKFGDITLKIGTGMSKGFYDWLSDAVDRKQSNMDGAVVTLAANFMVHSRLAFDNALITEIGFPALDAASKDAAKMTVKLKPEATAFAHMKAEKWQPGTLTKQKKWLASNFKIEIEGLDCSKVSKVDSFTWKCQINEVEDGGDKVVAASIEPGKVEFPNIVITMADYSETTDKFFKWWLDSLVEEDHDQRQGKLTWYAPDLKTQIGTVKLVNLGPIQVSHDDEGGAAKDAIRRVKAEMYCEEMQFKFNAPA